MFHQPHNTFGSGIYNSFAYENLSYEKHFHKGFEAWCCIRGKVQASCDDCEITLEKGDFLLVFPYVTHSFSLEGDAAMRVIVFSGDYVPELEKTALTKRPKVNVFTPDEKLLINIENTLFRENVTNGSIKPGSADEYAIKSGLYALTAAFLKTAQLVDTEKSDDISTEIIRYIEENYTQNINLRTMADALGYNYQHLSRVFRKTMKMNFRDLINQYRFDCACNALRDGKVSVTQAALDSGFQSVRNFNRVYKEKTGLSPKNEINRKTRILR
ncbi:MAG: AraC family transcriptional regulator [Firmicutes bacterium]|nr:AraC family transcriptional regulator [Bacillota bacterium]MDY5530766.1 AraC family transcriptional regulator [Pumilibacteraceae bacterium]